MSNAGPLTTTFTAPSSCATAAGLYQIWNDADTYYYEQGPLASRTDCYPSGYNASPSQYYSPGVCPHGYTAACSSTDVISKTTETAYTCCPTAASYTCAGTAALFTSGQQYLGCTSTFGDAIAVAHATAISSGSTYSASATIESSGVGIGANSIAVRFRAGDFSTGSTATTGKQSIASSTSAVLSMATSPPPQQTSSSSTSSSHSGLSTVGMAGIGVGSAAGALFLAGFLGLFLWLRKRKQKTLKQLASSSASSSSQFHRPSQKRPPPPPRPARPITPPLPPPPPPPPKSSHSSRWPSHSPTPSITSDITTITTATSKQLYATLTTIRPVRNDRSKGPFELGGSTYEPYEKKDMGSKKDMSKKDMFELYGSPTVTPTPSSDPLRSNPSTPSPSPYWMQQKQYQQYQQQQQQQWSSSSASPPPGYYAYYSTQEPVELESPQNTLRSPKHGHRRMQSERFGTMWAPAELASPDGSVFL